MFIKIMQQLNFHFIIFVFVFVFIYALSPTPLHTHVTKFSLALSLTHSKLLNVKLLSLFKSINAHIYACTYVFV